MKRKTPSLTFCIIMDLMGYMSFAVPVVGEITDIIWAPVSALVFFFAFGRKKFGLNGAVFSFIEEIMPGLDFIPTFTIAWFVKQATASKASLAGNIVPAEVK